MSSASPGQRLAGASGVGGKVAACHVESLSGGVEERHARRTVPGRHDPERARVAEGVEHGLALGVLGGLHPVGALVVEPAGLLAFRQRDGKGCAAFPYFDFVRHRAHARFHEQGQVFHRPHAHIVAEQHGFGGEQLSEHFKQGILLASIPAVVI